MNDLSKLLDAFESPEASRELEYSTKHIEHQDSRCDVVDREAEDQDKVYNFLSFLAAQQRSKEEIELQLDEKLVPVYKKVEFRHSYFKISALLQELKKKSNEADSFDALKKNLSILESEIIINDKYNIIDSNGRFLKNKFYKLCDHCNLEISRFSYFDQFFWRNDKAKEDLEKVSADYEKSKEDFKEAKKDFKEVREYMSNARSEYVTILSIFAAIMLAGIGGFSVLGDFAKEVTHISNYRFFAISSFLGLILFNVVFMLIYMIARLTGKNIYTICTNSKKDRNSDCAKGDCSNNCCGLERVRRRLPYIFWSNLILVVVIILSLSLEYLVNQFALADWLLILFGFIFIGLSLYYGIKNSKA